MKRLPLNCSRLCIFFNLLEIGEKLEDIEKQKHNVLTDDLRKLLVRIHKYNAVIRTDGACIDQDGVNMRLNLIFFVILFIKKVLSDFVSLNILNRTFSLVMISS